MFGTAVYWGYNQHQEKQRLEIFMGNKYQQAFYNLVESVEQLQVLLGKSLVSTSPDQNIMILTDVWGRSNIAQADLNQLPLAAQTVYETAKFLSQTGDYAQVMAKKNASGEVLSEENRETLNVMRQHAVKVVESLHDIEEEVLAGRINWTEMVRAARNKLRGESVGATPLDGFDGISKQTEELPVLIYDGPFSDHIADQKAKAVTGNNISEENAREKAAKILDNPDNLAVNVSEGTSVNGRIPSYNFQLEVGEYVYSLDMSKKGGHVVTLIGDRPVEGSGITQEEAADKAKDYLARIGYPGMEATYSEMKNNTAYISFAYKEDDVICYPDIINVQVALDNGQLIALEAMSYLMSHEKREIEDPGITEEEARTTAEASLDEIENVRLAVIPQPGIKEVFTYEVRGTTGEETYLIYVNAKTGREEEILKVIKGKDGTFAL